jgi:hypothetical protein
VAWERRHLFVMVRERSLSLKFGRKGERYLLIARVRELPRVRFPPNGGWSYPPFVRVLEHFQRIDLAGFGRRRPLFARVLEPRVLQRQA